MRQLLQDVRELPASVAVIQQVLDRFEDPSATNQMFEDLLVQDPAVTAGVLRLANSAFFGVPSQIRTLNTAVRIVGRRRLKTLLRHLLVGQLFEVMAAQSPAIVHARNEALAAGVVCYEIGGALCELEAEEFRIGGLLHNVGELVVISRSPSIHREYLEWREAMSPEQAAKAALGLSFDALGALFLENWRFPAIYVEATRLQTQPLQARSEAQRLASAMLVGRVLATAWQDRAKSGDVAGPLEQTLLDHLGMDKVDVERIYTDIGPAVEGLHGLLRPVVHR